MANNVLRRALLYVPGSSQKYLDKSRSLGADCIVYDLEDSVTSGRKTEARSLVTKALEHRPLGPQSQERAVRINSVSSGLALEDLTSVLPSPNLTTIVVPKVDSASDLTFVADVIAHLRPGPSYHHDDSSRQRQDQNFKAKPTISILALIESARSLTSLAQITAAAPQHLSGLIFAAEDFALDLSLTRTPALTEFLFARSAIVTAARVANLPSIIDLTCTAFKSEADHELLERECQDGKRMGFNGKQCIHPGQVGTVTRAFSPSNEELEWAVRVMIAQRKAEDMGKGAWALDGKVIDRPVERKAWTIVDRAKSCGCDLVKLRSKFRDVNPE